MADIVNLRRARKDKARRDRDTKAEANRLRFGRNKAQKASDEDAEARRRRTLDERLLDPDKPGRG
jgi:Domain of unknown function (DUF4169)